MNINLNKKSLALTLVFIMIGVLTRTVLHIADNVEFLTAVAITSGLLLNKRLSYATVFSILIITDFVIGNTEIIIYTWSAFLGAAIAMSCLKGRLADKSWSTQIISAQGAGVFATLVFFLWTNLGVVLTTNMYSKDLTGLLESYKMALPFLRNQLGGNLIFVPLVFTLSYILLSVDLQKYFTFRKELTLNQQNGSD